MEHISSLLVGEIMTDISDVRKSSLILSAFSAKTNSAESEPQLNTKTKIKRMKQKSKIEV